MYVSPEDPYTYLNTTDMHTNMAAFQASTHFQTAPCNFLQAPQGFTRTIPSCSNIDTNTTANNDPCWVPAGVTLRRATTARGKKSRSWPCHPSPQNKTPSALSNTWEPMPVLSRPTPIGQHDRSLSAPSLLWSRESVFIPIHDNEQVNVFKALPSGEAESDAMDTDNNDSFIPYPTPPLSPTSSHRTTKKRDMRSPSPWQGSKDIKRFCLQDELCTRQSSGHVMRPAQFFTL
eukprot:m.334137 g.334137  ORF g.334137 m.334137 type:complete len:232 (-) comp17299_c0_seq1:183-878(-)